MSADALHSAAVEAAASRRAGCGRSRGSPLSLFAALAGLLAAGCGAAVPDLTPFADATTGLYQSMTLVGSETARQLAPLSTPIVCPAASPARAGSADDGRDPPRAPARTTPRGCFERLWAPRLAAVAAFVSYADRLSQIAASAGQGDRAEAATSALEGLFSDLAAPLFAGPVADAAGQALDAWRRERAAQELAGVVGRAVPHVAAVVDVLMADLADTRALMTLVGQKLRLDRIEAHNDELSLREGLEHLRRAYIERLEQHDLGRASEVVPVRADDRPSVAEILAALDRIEALLARLPSEDSLTPTGVDAAIATIDAAARALDAWRDAHARLARTLAERRAPDLHRLRAATEDLHRLLGAWRD